jgi:hypothetical protein
MFGPPRRQSVFNQIPIASTNSPENASAASSVSSSSRTSAEDGDKAPYAPLAASEQSASLLRIENLLLTVLKNQAKSEQQSTRAEDRLQILETDLQSLRQVQQDQIASSRETSKALQNVQKLAEEMKVAKEQQEKFNIHLKNQLHEHKEMLEKAQARLNRITRKVCESNDILKEFNFVCKPSAIKARFSLLTLV